MKEGRERGPGKMAPWFRALVTLAEFSSQHLYSNSKPSETPVLEDLIMFFSFLHWSSHICDAHMYM